MMTVMQLTTCSLLLACSAFAGVSAGAAETINVDVAIVGGGATGAYAAVRLREDYQKKVVVIEKQDRLVSVILLSGFLQY